MTRLEFCAKSSINPFKLIEIMNFNDHISTSAIDVVFQLLFITYKNT